MPPVHSFRLFTLLGALAAGCPAAEFAPPMDIADGSVSGLSAMAAADIDGDGLVDVLGAEGGKHAGGRRTFAWFAAPADTQAAWTRHDIAHGASLRPFLGAVALHDIDADGDQDIVLCSDQHSGSTMAADVLVFFNPGDGAGTWSHHLVNPSTLPYHHINDLRIGDCDGDGRPDIVVRSLEPNEIHIFFQESPTDWIRRSIATGLAQSEGLGLGDLDDDGLADITFTGFWLDFGGAPRSATAVRRPIDAAYHQTNQNTKEFVADIDGDGDSDVVIGPAEAYRGGDDHVLAWYENTGDWSGDWPRRMIQSNANDMHSVLGGDIDGDGSTDLVIGIPWGDRQVRVYFNNGAGGFDAPQIVEEGKGLYSGVLADLGADGDLDIIGQNVYAGSSKPWVYEQLGSAGLDWQIRDDLNRPRGEHATAAIRGTIYVLGGIHDSTSGPAEVEVYDPLTDQWTDRSSMPAARHHVTPAVHGTEIWICGGKPGGDDSGVARVDVYDTLGDRWRQGPDLPGIHWGGPAVVLGHSLHVLSGATGNETTSDHHWTLDLRDPAASWQTAAPVPEARVHAAGVAIGGRIYLLGGEFHHSHDGDTAIVQVYDPVSDSWGPPAAGLPEARSHLEWATFAHGGRIYSIAGVDSSQSPRAQDGIHRYDPGSDSWTTMTPLPERLASPGARIIGDQLYVCGGGIDDWFGGDMTSTWSAALPPRANRPPVADLQVSTTSGPAPLTVTASGAGSSDPEGDPLTLVWNSSDGGRSTGNDFSHVFAAGTHHLVLTVSDDQGNRQSATTTITVTADNNQAPVLSGLVADPATITSNATTLSASASDPDGDSLTYTWVVAEPPAANPVLNGSGATVGLTVDQAGSYTVTCTVADGRGGSTSGLVTVTVVQSPTSMTINP